MMQGAYETKVLLLAIADIIRSSKTTREALERLATIANAEGVILDTVIKDKE